MTATHAPLAGRREWLAAMQATLGACACCLLVAWLAPPVRPWVPLVLSVLWFRGPIGFLLPVGLEPVLMEYGASHPLVAVVAITAVASAVAETISLRVMRGMASLEALTGARQSLRDSRIVRLFERRPGAAVAFGALSPVPDWITRSLAAVSGYHPVRYVMADTLGRLPKLWIPAAAGGLVPLDPTLTRAFLVSQFLLVGGVLGLRWIRSRRRARRPSIAVAPCGASSPPRLARVISARSRLGVTDPAPAGALPSEAT